MKTYLHFMSEISPNELYKGLLVYGMFSEKLPPIFTSLAFYNYCNSLNPSFPNKEYQYVFYESMRNINIPRPLAIPNPMAYQKQCKCLADNWPNILSHFRTQTMSIPYAISRIHIRKRNTTESLFEMNYSDWRSDGSPELDILPGMRYQVCADISNCFPSIYSHSIPWALVGKDIAKTCRSSDRWFNKIDYSCRCLKCGETHGLLIGIHTSNLLSEIILTTIDNHLYNKGYRFIRKIDDYVCYTPTYEQAQFFLIDLAEELRNYDLLLNHKKTSIEELPIATIMLPRNATQKRKE